MTGDSSNKTIPAWISEQAAHDVQEWVTAWKQAPVPVTIHRDQIHFGNKKITRGEIEILLHAIEEHSKRADAAEAELAALRAAVKPEYAFRYADAYGTEETSWAFASEDDARQVAERHRHGGGTGHHIVTRLAGDWQPVNHEEN